MRVNIFLRLAAGSHQLGDGVLLLPQCHPQALDGGLEKGRFFRRSPHVSAVRARTSCMTERNKL